MYFECTWNVTRMSQVYQEYVRNITRWGIKCCRDESQLNRYRVWPPGRCMAPHGRCCFTPDLLQKFILYTTENIIPIDYVSFRFTPDCCPPSRPA